MQTLTRIATPTRKASCEVQMAPGVSIFVDVLGSVGELATDSRAAEGLASMIPHEDYAAYYAKGAEAFRQRSKLPAEDDSFYEQLF